MYFHGYEMIDGAPVLCVCAVRCCGFIHDNVFRIACSPGIRFWRTSLLPSESQEPVNAGNEGRTIFANRNFVKLWAAQMVSSMGDWLGFFALLPFAEAMSGRVGTVVVLQAKVIPNLFFAPIAGVLVDRWDRRRTMMICDICRGCTFLLMPFSQNLVQLFVLTLFVEFLSSLWTPAKEAMVPKIVHERNLLTANSLGTLAAFGIMPLGAVTLTFLSWNLFEPLAPSTEHLAMWVNSMTFFLSVFLVFRLQIAMEKPSRSISSKTLSMEGTWHEFKEGFEFMRGVPIIKIVMLGISAALFGGAMIVPLATEFVDVILHETDSGAYGLLQAGVGVGGIIGMFLVNKWTRNGRHSHLHAFTLGIPFAAVSLFAVASVNTVGWALLYVVFLGTGAGISYSTGITVLQENVKDELRGRIFAVLNTMNRVGLVVSWAVTPLLLAFVEPITDSLVPDGVLHLPFGYDYSIAAVRVVLWIGATYLLVVGIWCRRSSRSALLFSVASDGQDLNQEDLNQDTRQEDTRQEDTGQDARSVPATESSGEGTENANRDQTAERIDVSRGIPRRGEITG